MAEAKESTSVPLSQGQADSEDESKSPPNSPNSSTRKVRLSLSLSKSLIFTRFGFSLSTGDC